MNSIGAFRDPKLKTELKEVNVQKRLNYAKSNKGLEKRLVLFTDESAFDLTHYEKVFKFKEEPTPV